MGVRKARHVGAIRGGAMASRLGGDVGRIALGGAALMTAGLFYDLSLSQVADSGTPARVSSFDHE